MTDESGESLKCQQLTSTG